MPRTSTSPGNGPVIDQRLLCAVRDLLRWAKVEVSQGREGLPVELVGAASSALQLVQLLSSGVKPASLPEDRIRRLLVAVEQSPFRPMRRAVSPDDSAGRAAPVDPAAWDLATTILHDVAASASTHAADQGSLPAAKLFEYALRDLNEPPTAGHGRMRRLSEFLARKEVRNTLHKLTTGGFAGDPVHHVPEGVQVVRKHERRQRRPGRST